MAAQNPEHAWFPTERSAQELATVDEVNRAVTSPGYPKYMNAIMDVDQGAAVLLMSVREAARLGIPEHKWVYLHGCADAYDWPTSAERAQLHRAPAMAMCARKALQDARVSMCDVKHMDIYSCFPSAVQLARREMGFEHIGDAQSERLTLTGGLPFHGGPGNNYSMHSVAARPPLLVSDSS